MAKSHRWGWCGEGCPLFDETNSWNTAWETEETLTVTTHTVLQVDKDLYVMIVLLVLMAFCLFSFTGTLKLHGTHVTFILFKNEPECEIIGSCILEIYSIVIIFTIYDMILKNLSFD